MIERLQKRPYQILIGMRSANRTTNYDNIQDLISAAKKLSHEEHREQSTVSQIVVNAFGNTQIKGLINQRLEYYHKKSPVNWAEELDAVTKAFSPHGELLSGPGGIIATADYTTSIEPKILPKSVLDEFSGQGDKSSSMLKSLKRELIDKYTINIWQWFWSNLAYALINHPELEQKRTLKEDQQEDQLFFMLSRNPYLIIARRALHHNYRKDSLLLERARGVFQLYIINELLFITKREARMPNSKYHLKSQYLAMIFLLIHSRKGRISGPTMEIYQEWFLKATEYYSTISSQSNSHNIRNLVRVWVYLLTREHSLDGSLIKQLQNANPTDGWYRLSRCPLHLWLQAVKKVSFYSQQLPSIITIRKNIYRLLSKHSEWIPSFSFLAALEQFLQFDQGVLQKYIRRQAEKEEYEIVARCFERILVSLAENGANCESLEKQQTKLNERYKDKLTKKLTVNFAQRSQQAKQKLSRSSRQQSKSISFQSPRIRNVWQHPLQQNQFYILFVGSYWVSRQLDKLIPGHSKRSYPCINIRIFSNPIAFLLLFLAITIAVKVLLLE